MQSTSEHTPGPWEYIPARDSDGDETLSIRGDGLFIATMDLVSVNGGAFVLPPAGEANARLIAAAPDLLYACTTALAQLSCAGIRPIACIEKAIRKAEGE